MRNTPWSTLAASLKKLSDRMDAAPTVREATLVSDSAVRFDIDSQNTTVHGTLAPGLPAGTRVLTLTLKHYVWILGGRDKAPLSLPIASKAQAEAGTANDVLMTPLRTKEAITKATEPVGIPYFLGIRTNGAGIVHNTWVACNMQQSNNVLEHQGLSVNGNTITIQKTGIYTLYGAAKWDGNGGGNSRAIAFLISEYTIGQIAESNLRVSPMYAATIPVTTSWTGPLAAGTTVQLVVTQNSGGVLNIGHLEFGISYIGPK